MNGDNSFGWNHEATLDNIHAQKYNKAYAGARLQYTKWFWDLVMVLQTIPAKRSDTL